MKKRKPRKPRDWAGLSWAMKDVDGCRIYISSLASCLDAASADSLGRWLIKAAKWAKAQEGNK